MTLSKKLIRWFFCMLLCVLTLLGLAQGVFAEAPQTAERSEQYTSLVRYRGKATSSVIGQLEDGTQITVLDETEDFYKIDCYETAGYIAKSQVRVTWKGEYYVNCDPESPETTSISSYSLAEILSLRFSILNLARQQLGTPYVYGGKLPGGFDCSGFTYYIMAQHGIDLFRCADDQMQNGVIVSSEKMQVGDLVFFRYAGCPWLASHVGIYVGNNQMLHASSSRGIRYSDLDAPYYAEIFVGARRILVSDTSAAQQIHNLSQHLQNARLSSGLRTVP